MAPEVMAPMEEGMGLEGVLQTQGIAQTEGLGIMEGVAKSAPSRAAASSAPPKPPLRSAFPSMRSAVVWAEILGKPKALQRRK